MTILHLLHTYDVTGGATRAMTLKKWWPKACHHAAIGMRYKGTLPVMKAQFEEVGFHTQEIRSADTQALSRAFSLVKGPIEGVIIYNWEPSGYFIQGLRDFGYKGEIVVRIDTVLPESISERLKGADKPGVTYVVISEAARTQFNTLVRRWYSGGLSYSPVLLIRNAPDRVVFTPAPWRENPNPMYVGFSGRLATDKDHDLLIRVAGMVAYPMKFIVAGDGVRRSKLEAEAERLAPGKIEFWGAVPHNKMVEFYHWLDVYVQASLPIEGSSNSLLEAASCCLPLLCTDVPAHREIALGATFLNDVPNSDHILAQYLDRMASSKDLRRASRYNVESAKVGLTYSSAVMVQKYIDIFEG